MLRKTASGAIPPQVRVESGRQRGVGSERARKKGPAAPVPAPRTAKTTAHRAGDKWSVEVQLEEGDRTYDVRLDRSFATEGSASRAGEQVAADWLNGAVSARDLILQELAAMYRRLRATQKTMRPASVPTTRSSWENAFEAWEQLGWIDPADAGRYREQARCAFDAISGPVRRHRLGADPDTESDA